MALAKASEELTAWLIVEATAESFARLAVPHLADWCAIDLLEEDGSLRESTSGHRDPAVQRLLLNIRARYRASGASAEAAGARQVLKTGEPALYEDASNIVPVGLSPEQARRFRALAVKSYLLLPMTIDGEPFGVLTLVSTARHYSRADLPAAESHARRAADAIESHWRPERAARRAAVLDTVYRTAPVGLGFVDTELRYRRVNGTLAAINGLPVADHLGRTVEQVLGDPFGTGLARILREVLETGRPMEDVELGGAHRPAAGGPRHWLASYSPVVVDGEIVGVSAMVRDVTERKREELDRAVALRRATFLARASEELGSSLDQYGALQRVAELAVPEVAGLWAVHVRDPEGAMRSVHAEQGSRPQWSSADPPPLVKEAIATARIATVDEPDAVPDALACCAGDRERLVSLALRAAVSAPLVAGGDHLGAVTIGLAQTGSGDIETAIAFADDFARCAAVAIGNLRRQSEQREIAETLQSALLPAAIPHLPGVELASSYRPVGELNRAGGDFYDVFERPNGEWLIVVGDIAGKGARAAAATALARYTLRAAARHDDSLSELLEVLNDEMRAQAPDGMFATVCLTSVRPRAGECELTLVLGGHPPALVLRADGAVEALGRPGSLIGVFPDPTLCEVDATLAGGDTLLVYTDGAYDAAGRDSGWGEEALSARLGLLRGRSPQEVVTCIAEQAVGAAGEEPADDIALVALRVSER